MVHPVAAHALGWQLPRDAVADANLRSVARLLETALRRDATPLSRSRAPDRHLFCTCRDFALLAAGLLRGNGIPARLRVGYASYFVPGRWEDHWVCERWTGELWTVLDAELGPRARRHFGVGFDIGDVPASAWRSAPSAWRAIRSGAIDPATCGVSVANLAGEWFVAAAVLRDAAALAGIEALPWDYWGLGREFCRSRRVAEEQAPDIDALAAALDPAPATLRNAEAVLARFPWARPSATVLTFPDGQTAAELPLHPA